jgi:hypothetical protein
MAGNLFSNFADLIGRRKKAADGEEAPQKPLAAPTPTQAPKPKTVEPEPEMEVVTGPDGMPRWSQKLKRGGVIRGTSSGSAETEEEMLRRRYALKQKRGC